MNVYVNEEELKAAYIGECREWTYSYTFKWKTASEIWNDWTAQIGTIVVNSEWLSGQYWNEMRITKSNLPSLTNAKKIIFTWTVIWQNITATAGALWIWKGDGWWTWNTQYSVYWSQYGGLMALLYYNWTTYSGNSVWNATAATYRPTTTIDLENKTITGVLSWFNNSVLTLTDAQVADIRTYTYVFCYISYNRSTISDISITIQY